MHKDIYKSGSVLFAVADAIAGAEVGESFVFAVSMPARLVQMYLTKIGEKYGWRFKTQLCASGNLHVLKMIAPDFSLNYKESYGVGSSIGAVFDAVKNQEIGGFQVVDVLIPSSSLLLALSRVSFFEGLEFQTMTSADGVLYATRTK